MRKDSQISTVWNYFEKVEGGAKCSECRKVIACFGNTSNLVKHLRRIHKHVMKSGAPQSRRKRKLSSDFEESCESEGVAPSEEEHTETIAETNSAVHTIQAYRDVNGTTFLYLQPAPEGETAVQIQNTQVQPIVATSESITANGEIVSVAVQKEPALIEGQAVDDGTKTQEETSHRRLVHAPVKNYQGSSATRTVVRQIARPSPVKTTSPTNSNNHSNSSNSNKEDSYDAFGKYIASMLRNIPAKTACRLQGEIVNWILKEQMKNNS